MAGDGFFSELLGGLSRSLFGGTEPATKQIIPPASTDPSSFYGPEMQTLQSMGVGPGGIVPSQGGFLDVTGDSGSVRGDEVTDTADLIAYILQGANAAFIRMEAKRRRYTKADFNAVMKIGRNAAQVAELVGLTGGGVFPQPVFFQAVAALERVLRGKRRSGRKMVGLKVMFKSLQQASFLASLLRRAGSGLARLSTHGGGGSRSAPQRRYRSGQFTRMVGRN